MKEKKGEWLRRLLPAIVALLGIMGILLVRALFWIGETETLGEATAFGSYIRRRDGITSYIGRGTFETLPEDCFSEYFSDDGAMRITLSNTPCGTPPGNSDGGGTQGWYFVEGWFDWLEIPAVRGEDSVTLTMHHAVYGSDEGCAVIRYTLEGDRTEYIAVYDGNLYGETISLPKGKLSSLQIYLGFYMRMQRFDAESFSSLVAEYKHSRNSSQDAPQTRYYHFHNTHYIPKKEG